MIYYPCVHSFGPNFIIFHKHGKVPVGLNILALIEWLWLHWGVPRWNTVNRPLPSSKNPFFQNEDRCATFLVKMGFICMRMKNNFHIKGWAPTLVLKWRPGELGNGFLALDLISSFKPELCLSRYLFCAKAEQPAIMMMMMMMIAFLQHRKLLLTHYRNKKNTDLYNYIIIHTTMGKTDSYMN